VAIAGNTRGADVIEHQSYLDTASSDFGESLEEVIGRRVPAHDVELHVTYRSAVRTSRAMAAMASS
jgi:hypothetical protein